MDYAVTIPLWSKVLVKEVDSPEDAILLAKRKVAESVKHASIDYSEDIDVFSATQEKHFHLISRP